MGDFKEVNRKYRISFREIIRQSLEYFGWRDKAHLDKAIREFELYGTIPPEATEYCRLIIEGRLKL